MSPKGSSSQVPPPRPPHRTSDTGTQRPRRSERLAGKAKSEHNDAPSGQDQVISNLGQDLLNQENALLGMTNSPEVADQLIQIQKMQAHMFEMQAKLGSIRGSFIPEDVLLSAHLPLLAGAGPSSMTERLSTPPQEISRRMWAVR